MAPFTWQVDDETGVPEHLPMGVDKADRGPVADDHAHHFVCWCGDTDCLLTSVLRLAWDAGRRDRVI